MDSQEIVSAYQNGVKIASITYDHKCSSNTMYALLDELGIPRKGPARKVSEEAKDEIVRLYSVEKKSVRAIAAIYGCSVTPIYWALRERGTTMRKKWTRRKNLQ